MTLSWVAGFYEADGALCKAYGRYRRVQIVQANRSVLIQIQRRTGYGKVYPRNNIGSGLEKRYAKRHYKKQWVLSGNSQASVLFLKLILPHMQLSWRIRTAKAFLRSFE